MTELEAFAKYPNCGNLAEKSIIIDSYTGADGMARIVIENDDGTFVHMTFSPDGGRAITIARAYVPKDTTDYDLKALTETSRYERTYPKQHLMSRGAVPVDCYKNEKGGVVVVYQNPNGTYYHMELGVFRG